MRLGIDLDNTIIGYDISFRSIVVEQGWLSPAEAVGSKKDIRDAVRLLPEGEPKWMQMQALAYGPLMDRAELIEGSAEFISRCRQRGDEIVIVSHKTRHAAADPGGTDLREAALGWLEAKGFFSTLGLSSKDIFFEDTRRDKCRCIADLGCTLFIDDLEEVFADPSFPSDCRRILFHPGDSIPEVGYEAFAAWKDIHDAVFG